MEMLFSRHFGGKMRQKLAVEQSNQTARKLHTTDERPEMLRDLK